ncbi:GNAT family N-acetyltransferase [Agrobacterium sp. a22-2]|uniref:GNAT family N-acetyltransferase n=1 Tax=Agrobacterium sp. a22-2 TaxID=2283840 RepID=UPI0014455565|nr:GNAT family N-acetyltransferase [Agrobacterium sp. a22-2]NKN38349.1 GNAT family N-acetyltransferase [Agrobacterium sp. a22-2]
MTDDDPKLEVLDQTPPEDERAVLSALRAHNNQMLGPTDRRDLSIPIRDGDGKTEGGLIGYTGRGWLCVEMLFVPARYRGRGMAGKLLQMAEDEAKARGCTGAYIDTINPAARRAYERQGYKAFGSIDNFSGDYGITWLMKRF